MWVIMSDKSEHIKEAIDRTVDLLTKYHIKDDAKLREATKEHYLNLLKVEVEMLKQ